MRRSNTQSIGQVLSMFVKENHFERKLKEVDIVQSWEELLGKTIAHYTKNVSLKNGVLQVEISSPVVKNELFLLRDEIIRKINDRAGEEVVNRMVFK